MPEQTSGVPRSRRPGAAPGPSSHAGPWAGPCSWSLPVPDQTVWRTAFCLVFMVNFGVYSGPFLGTIFGLRWYHETPLFDLGIWTLGNRSYRLAIYLSLTIGCNYCFLYFTWYILGDYNCNFTVDSLWALGRISWRARWLRAAPLDVHLVLVLVVHELDLHMITVYIYCGNSPLTFGPLRV